MSTPLVLNVQSADSPEQLRRHFKVVQQKLDLDIDGVRQAARGSTTITLAPTSKDLKQILLNCRQTVIKSVQVDRKTASFVHDDPYRRRKFRKLEGVRQHRMVRERLRLDVEPQKAPELSINLPRSVKIQEDYFAMAQNQSDKAAKLANDVVAFADTPAAPLTAMEPTVAYIPLTVVIEFEIPYFYDGLQFQGFAEGDLRYPHIFTRHSRQPGTACCIFPCVDEPQERCEWEINIRCARTLGDALGIASDASSATDQLANGTSSYDEVDPPKDRILSAQEMSMEMVVVCSGEVTDEIPDPAVPGMKTVSFACDMTLSASQIGFAIGPFESISLSDFREVDEDEKLGTESKPVQAFCLPTRTSEVRNTAMPMARAMDFFTQVTQFPFQSYKMCFVEDLGTDTVVAAGLSFCSTRLLFPEEVIDRLYEVIRKLVYAMACQYSGVTVIPKEPEDTWAIMGMAYFLTDIFLKSLMGNNEYRYRQKLASDRIFEMDVNRPSIHALGALLHLDASEEEFLALKTSAVLFILDRRLQKMSGSAGMSRIIARVLRDAKGDEADSALLSTQQFLRTCEKLGHSKLDEFFNQWVFGAGCPHFLVSQRFNKKKLVVEMQILQVQGDPDKHQTNAELDPSLFMRDVAEEQKEVYDEGIQHAFAGPMTIRIHEADGTPYEHIVQIREANTRIEIPYNTKYKRLKRSKKQKERVANARAGGELDIADDTLLYCLGDVLQTEEEMRDWQLVDWSEDDELKMGQESYEWIRMDADFEWICRMQIAMPGYMYVSQLQQDRDVVAQLESVQYINTQLPNWLVSTFLTRTVMDRRYFHGVRTLAALGLARTARDELNWIGFYHLDKIFSELFCGGSKSALSRQNDFSDRALYLLQCAVPQALAQIRDVQGHAPMMVKRFFIDKLKFNDNSLNDYSDCYYIVNLLNCLTEVLVATPDPATYANYNAELDAEISTFRKEAIGEIEHYRRIDEWISSYHNLYSTTALKCLYRLASANAIAPGHAEFLLYTRPENSDLLRITAFDCLADLDGLGSDATLRFFLYSLSTDPSPFVREHIYRAFGRALGHMAIGTKPKGSVQDTEPMQGLIIEQDGSTEKRKTELERKQDLSKALAALKDQIAHRTAFQEALWQAIRSPVLHIDETERLLDICGLFYEAQDTFMVSLKYPRYWRVDQGTTTNNKLELKFTQSNRVRTTPCPVPHMQEQLSSKPSQPTETIKLPKLSLKSSALNGQSSNSPDRNKAEFPTPTSGRPALILSRRGSSISQLAPNGDDSPEPKMNVPASPASVSRKPSAPLQRKGKMSKIVRFVLSAEKLAAVVKRHDDEPSSHEPQYGPITTTPRTQYGPIPSASASSSTTSAFDAVPQYGPISTGSPVKLESPSETPVMSYGPITNNTNGANPNLEQERRESTISSSLMSPPPIPNSQSRRSGSIPSNGILPTSEGSASPAPHSSRSKKRRGLDAGVDVGRDGDIFSPSDEAISGGTTVRLEKRPSVERKISLKLNLGKKTDS